MAFKFKKNGKRKRLWLISGGRPSGTIPDSVYGIEVTGPFKEYVISDFARYLLYPGPITIEDRLVGVNIIYRQTAIRIMREQILKWLPGTHAGNDEDLCEYLVSDAETDICGFRDNDLKRHFYKISSLLRPYNPLIVKLAGLDIRKTKDLTGICEDIAGNRYRLDLHGNVEEKLGYILTNLLNKVKIILKKAHLSDGLFELRGFDFKSFEPSSTSTLLSFYSGERHIHAVAGSPENPGFIVEDPEIVFYMHLFEQSIITNPELRESLELCLNGEAEPFKLFFSKRLEFAYSNNHLPGIFRKEFDVNQMDEDEKNQLAHILNSQQKVVSFNYVPISESGKDKMFTNISVMHDFRALEPIRKNLPRLYSEINDRVHISEAGALYLLDSIRGCKDG